jgi:hypothetical protein
VTKAKLILGTANMGVKPYGTLKEQLSLNEINRILDYARANGITTLESSEAYFCDPVLRANFDLIYKVTHPYSLNRVLNQLGRTHLLGLMYHHGFDTLVNSISPDDRVLYRGASIYDYRQLDGSEDMIEVHLNIENREFEAIRAKCVLARSVFGRGELLKKYSIKECLSYVAKLPNIHGVVVGVDNVAQLKEIVEAWNQL